MNTFLCRFYTIICVFSPLFVIYSFLGDSFTFLDTLIFLFYALSLPTYIYNNKGVVESSYAILFLFVLLHSVLCLFVNGDSSIFLRAMHLANYIFFIAYYNFSFFQESFAQKCLRYFSLSATIFLFIQHIVYFVWGIPVPGMIPGFAMLEANLGNMIMGTDVIRFASFFVEPASYAQVIICALAHELFYSKKLKGLYIAILCIGCVISTSNTALACMVLLLGFFFLKNGMFNRNLVLIVALFFLLLIFAGPFIEANLTRIEGGRSFSGRFEGYDYLKEVLTNPFIGIGFVSPTEMNNYMSGFPRLFLYMGLIGLVVYSIVFLSIFKKTGKKILFFVFLFLNLGSDTLLGVGFLYYSCFIISSIKGNESLEMKLNTNENLNNNSMLQ